MSLESAKAFAQKYKEDAEFRKKINDAPNDEARKKLVQDAGYSFTKKEMEETIKGEKAELSDEQLEAVAGGKSASWTSTGVTIGVAVAAAGL